MTVTDIFDYSYQLIVQLGLLPFIQAGIIITLTVYFVRKLFGRGDD